MLASLSIRHYALIDEFSLDLPSGLVILTGETGAGKSIIIDALGLLLGDRASPDVVRSGALKATVEGVFFVATNDKVRSFLEENQLDHRDELLLRREVSVKGQSRCFTNDTPVPLSTLKQIGDLLVDLHGQHEHQSLLRPQTHIELLDAFCHLEELVGEYRAVRTKLMDLASKLSDLRGREQKLREVKDFYSFQLKEINAVDPHMGEEEELQAEITLLENSEKLFTVSKELYELLYQGDRSAYELLADVRDRLQVVVPLDKKFEAAVQESGAATEIVRELARFLQEYSSNVEFNPDRLEELRNRIGQIGLLKKKYGGSIEKILAVREQIAGDLALVGDIEGTASKILQDLTAARNECGRIAQRLSVKRRESSRLLEREVVRELATLGIPNARFSMAMRQTDLSIDGYSESGAHYTFSDKKALKLNDRGFDEIEFFISTNLGEEVKPLPKVVSGGEISRIMLTLKRILAAQDHLPIVVFDEIDMGVSGRVAQAVGESLKKLSTSHQVIVITHLPQIASLADAHYRVFKTEDRERARTSVMQLSAEERVQEVARLLSGATVTDAAVTGARELIGQNQHS